MPEGPSLILAREQLLPFQKKTVTAIHGYGPMKKSWVKGKRLIEIKTWGKHLLLRFSNGTIRIHLMLFGSIVINQKKKVNPTLSLVFGKEYINFYVVNAVKIEKPLREVYDWRTDIMNKSWNAKIVKSKIKEHGKEFIGDLLMNQEVFTGVGNIIRNEVLYRSKVHPLSIVQEIPSTRITALVNASRKYGSEFLKQKRDGTLSKHWEVYEQEFCPKHDTPLKVKILGKVKRKTYVCETCQVLYGSSKKKPA